jgi:fluoride exporter
VRKLILVCAGGAIGSGARYLVGLVAAAALGPALPAGTFAVNVAGSFLIAVVMRLALRGRLSDAARLFLATGIMGGFTTYSSFAVETLRLFSAGSPGRAAAYLTATVVSCLAAGALGSAAVGAALARARSGAGR